MKITMKHQIEERMDLARQFAKRLMDSEADCKDLEQGLEENPKLKELYDDIATNLHSVNYERTDRQEWIDFQNKFLSRPSRHRNLIVRYAVVASVCIAVRMVYQVAQAVKVPIIGMGGIASAEDALEFILAGATAVSIGTANFFNPYATVETVRGIEEYMRRHKVDDINSLIGAVR